MKDKEKIELLGFALHKTRRKILEELNKSEFKTMTTLKTQTQTSISNISKTLISLQEKELVECVNPKELKNKLFRLTQKGKEIVEIIKEV